MQNPTVYSNAIGTALCSYISAVCGAAVTDLKLCLTAYHTNFEHNDNGIERYEVIKYPLPANGFLMVIQQRQSNNLFELASRFIPTSTRYVFYCIGDITSKKVPYLDTMESAVQDFTTFVLHNHEWELDTTWESVDVAEELREILIDHEHESIQKARLVEHFEDICRLCVKYSPPALARNPDRVLASMNATRKVAKINLMFSGQALSPFGQRVLRRGLKDRAKKMLGCDT